MLQPQQLPSKEFIWGIDDENKIPDGKFTLVIYKYDMLMKINEIRAFMTKLDRNYRFIKASEKEPFNRYIIEGKSKKHEF